MKQERLSKITDNEAFDVLVIGGGINGIGVFRELSLQGLKVLLVERNDYCGKASSAPSRMIHGGLRYLENAEFDLVRESLTERNRLLKNAPHLVRPLRTLVPIDHYLAGTLDACLRFMGLARPTSDRGALVVKAGLWCYDLFTRSDRSLPRHRFYGKTMARRQLPALKASVKCLAEYFDAWIRSPERLALELIQQGIECGSGSVALNYCAAELAGEQAIRVRCQESGLSRTVVSSVVVNATGAWIDTFNAAGGLTSRYVQGTKGSHVILNNRKLHDALNGSMVYYENRENRVCILFPYMGNVLAGSTDIPVSNLDDIRCTDDEVNYILDSLRQVFPDISFSQEQILYKFSGVRPLGAASKDTAGQIPRSHQLREDQLNGGHLLSLVGGKWTTFRAFAEQTTDRVLDLLHRDRVCSTQNLAIGGGRHYPTDQSSLDAYLTQLTSNTVGCRDQAMILFERYGTWVSRVIGGQFHSRLTPLKGASDYFLEEMDYLINQEDTKQLDDLVLRRTNLAIEGRLTANLLVELAMLMQVHRQWNDTQLEQQLVACSDKLNVDHGCSITVKEVLTCLQDWKTTVNGFSKATLSTQQ